MLDFITWTANPNLFDGFVTIRWYGLMFVIGFWIGYRIMYSFFKHEGAPEAWLDTLLIYVVVATIVGARLGHVFFYQWDYYSANPMEILKIWHGGLASHGGTIGIMIAVILFSIITVFILAGVRRRVNVYKAFVEGAKGGFDTAVRIIPYLVAILVSIGVFRASGAMDYILGMAGKAVEWMGGSADYVAALPTALMKPLSGSGARGMMVDAMQTYGADSFVGRLSCIFQGATDTTFYILAVYFGSVGVRHTRHAVSAGLLTDLCGVVAAIVVAALFFGGG